MMDYAYFYDRFFCTWVKIMLGSFRLFIYSLFNLTTKEKIITIIYPKDITMPTFWEHGAGVHKFSALLSKII